MVPHSFHYSIREANTDGPLCVRDQPGSQREAPPPEEKKWKKKKPCVF